MKSVLALLSLLTVSLAGPSQLYLSHWNDFKLTHDKVYNSLDEESLRFDIFTANLEKIHEHNERYKAGMETYQLGVTQFADMTEEEFVDYLALSGSNPMLQDAVDVYVAPNDIVLPENIDYREKNAVNPIKNQGSCGSCWAFSTTGALESINFLKTGDLLSFSEQNLVDCSNSYGNMGCGGGLMESGYNYIKDNGLESETDYPYTAHNGQCVYTPSKSVINITGHTNIEQSSEESLQAAIVEKGPIAVAVDASEWQLYNGGIFKTSRFSRLNHGVVAIGFSSENGEEYYIVRNSWGPSWGEQGYIRVARNADNQVGISDMACFPNL